MSDSEHGGTKKRPLAVPDSDRSPLWFKLAKPVAVAVAGQKREKQPFNLYPTGYLHINISEICIDEGKVYLLVAVDQASKFVHAPLYRQVTRQIAADFKHAESPALPRLHGTEGQ
ncbi:hypothetical protein [Halomonas sp. WWR20]